MDIDTCISKYLSIAPKIFPEESFFSSSKMGKLFKGIRGKARFDAERFESTVKEMLSGILGSQGEYALLQSEQSDQEPPRCRT